MPAAIVSALRPPASPPASLRVPPRPVAPSMRAAGARALELHRGGLPDAAFPVAPGLPTGHAALDARLPAGGWPRRALTELSLLRPGRGEMDLMAPCLHTVQRAGRLVMLFDPPRCLSDTALAQLGLDAAQVLRVETASLQVSAPEQTARARLWAVEQALRSGYVGAVVAWLPPQVGRDDFFRLQRAVRSHDGPAFVLHDTFSAVPQRDHGVRLLLRGGDTAGGGQGLVVRVLSRPMFGRLARRTVPVAELGMSRRRGAGDRGLCPLPCPGIPIQPRVASSGVAAPEAGMPARPAATFVNLA